MKKIVTLSLSFLSCLGVFAQLPVSTTAGKKQVVIEEFTGNTCGWCPVGHKIVDDLIAANPGKVFGVNIHPENSSISFTVPAATSSSKDFRVPAAFQVLAIPGVISSSGGGSVPFPAGIVNRMTPISPAVPVNSGGRLMDRNYWTGMTNTILTQNSYINIAGQAYVHPTTRQMIVNMEAYYTANGPSAGNKVVIALVQNNILAYQANGNVHYPAMMVGSNYKHNHALRAFINGGTNSGARGETMTGPVTTGTKWTKTFNFTVPAQYGTQAGKEIPAVLGDLEIIAYIAETSDGKDIVAVCKVPITITTSTDIFDLSNSSELLSNVNVYPNPMGNTGAAVFTIAKESSVTIEIVNALGQVVKSDKLDVLPIGEHKHEFDVTNLTNGIYFVNINVDGNISTKKISVLK